MAALSKKPCTLRAQTSCLLADRAGQDSSVPDAAAARLRKQGDVRPRPHQCHYSVIELRNRSRAIVRPFCRIRCEPDSWKARVDLFCFRVQLSSAEIQRLL
jgi:hypothetical protein